ncbi:fimbria/pilus outer membrane usher protein [Mixta mediterraneensis]|uniref:fimbria/pilus outer membrane usher protein n=1 Tax=Mixta mediterraneensis TaxID=2758443 RepID=UPI00187487FA|nr:fimbrial biogenesis outer membrane usher protein [Mixta mediterraneensis]
MKHNKANSRSLFFLLLFFSPVNQAEPFRFNMNAVESLGLSPEQAQHAIKQSDKPYGKINTGVYLNGKYSGVQEVDFGTDSKACLSSRLLHEFMFKPDLITKIPGTDCLDTKKASLVEMRYDRNENALKITAADFYLEKKSQFQNIQSGGFGTFFNYNANLNRSAGTYSRTDSVNALMSWGANYENVLVRTNFSYAHYSPSWRSSYSRKSLNSAWLETDLVNTYRFRGGYIGVGNSLFGAGQINGFTLDNNVGMRSGDSTVNVSGIAPGYAQVDIYQQGRVIFSRPVPAGPFLFESVPLFTAYADAEVVIREKSGGEQRQIIPRAAFNVSSGMASRFFMFAGQTDPSRGVGNVPVFGAEYRFPFYEYLQPFTGTLLAQHYTGVGAGVYANFIPYYSRGDMNFSVSRSGKDNNLGQKLSANLSGQFGTATPYLSLNWQSYYYRDLGESQQTLDKDYAYENYNPHYTVSAGISKPFGPIGSGISLSHYISWNMPARNALTVFGSYSTRYYTLSANVAYGWERGNNQQNSWSAMLNLRVPFKNGGKSGSLSSYVNRYQKNTIFGTSASQTITDNLDVGVGVDRYTGIGNSTRHYAQAFWRTPYVRTSSYYSGTDQHSRNYSANLSGAIVATDNTIVFSPAQMQDTFALITTGVKGYTSLSTPTARVVTNYDGLAIAPQLFEDRVNSVNIITKTLPEGAYVKNSHQEITVKRGAVGKIDFSSTQERIYLVKLMAGKINIPYGTKLFDEKANLLGYTIDENILMLNQQQADKLANNAARIRLNNNIQCYIEKNTFNPALTDDLLEVPVRCGEKYAKL